MIDVMNAIITAVGEETIVRTFVPNIRFNKAVCSPLREDSKPSFAWFVSEYSKRTRQLNTVIYFYDQATGQRGDIVEYVRLCYGLTFNDAVSFIKNVMSGVTAIPTIPATNNVYTYSYEIDEEDIYDHIVYWHTLGMSYEDLAINKIFIANSVHCYENGFHKRTITQTRENPIYVYDYQDSIKVYRPLDTRMKFFGNVRNDRVSGIDLLNKKTLSKDKVILIAKAKKDEAWVRKNVYNNVISFQTERTLNNPLLKKLVEKAISIVIIADNDETGVECANIRKNLINFMGGTAHIVYTGTEQKDFTDMATSLGNDIAKQSLINELKQWQRK